MDYLVQRKIHVTVLARNPAKKDKFIKAGRQNFIHDLNILNILIVGAEVVIGDITDIPLVAKTLHNVHTVISLISSLTYPQVRPFLVILFDF